MKIWNEKLQDEYHFDAKKIFTLKRFIKKSFWICIQHRDMASCFEYYMQVSTLKLDK